MSNASLKEQLQAVATQFTTTSTAKAPPENKINKASQPSSKCKPHSDYKPQKHKQLDNSAAKKIKPKWLDYVQYGVELLKVYFPGGFKVPSEVKPLKKGIKQDLIKQLSTISDIVTEDKACMVKSLTYYVNTMAYHKSVVEGAERIDLNGHPAGIVSAEEAKYSIEKQQAKLLAKQKAVLQPSEN